MKIMCSIGLFRLKTHSDFATVFFFWSAPDSELFEYKNSQKGNCELNFLNKCLRSSEKCHKMLELQFSSERVFDPLLQQLTRALLNIQMFYAHILMIILLYSRCH